MALDTFSPGTTFGPRRCLLFSPPTCMHEKIRVTVEQPDEERLQGRIGWIRIRATGFIDLGCAIMYPPSGARTQQRRILYNEIMDWAEKQLNALPCRSLRLVMIDGNAPLGQHQVFNDRNECLIGNARPQYEGRASPR